MRWKLAILAAALVLSPAARADTYVKTESITDGYYGGGQVVPPAESSTEMWIGKQRMAYVTEGQKLIVDAKNAKLIVVNRRENTYAETGLPLDLSKLFSEQELGTLNAYRRQGTVKSNGDSKKVGEWECAGYDVNDWVSFQGGRINERDVKAWYTTDVPFKLKKFNEMFRVLVELGNFADDYADRVLAVDGFRVATEETRYDEGNAIKTTETVVEMTEKKPPEDAYAVPEGCTKKELLTLQDLQG